MLHHGLAAWVGFPCRLLHHLAALGHLGHRLARVQGFFVLAHGCGRSNLAAETKLFNVSAAHVLSFYALA